MMVWELILFGTLRAAGVVIELLQFLVPGRGFCWRDVAANAAGIAAAGLCAWPLMSPHPEPIAESGERA